MKTTKITLEDRGQDFLELYVSEDGVIVDAQPFQADVWKGAYIPVGGNMVEVGKPCPIHCPPQISFGFLNYKIEKIEVVDFKLISNE